MVVWALVLLAGLLYLGVLEGRFGVDILRDGGVYEQLFMLRGLAGLSAAARSNAFLTSSAQYCSAVGQDFASSAVEVATKLEAQSGALVNKVAGSKTKVKVAAVKRTVAKKAARARKAA